MGQLSTPTQDLIDRLNFHTANVPGRILQGFKWTPIPIKEGETIEDLPSVRLFVPDVRDRYKPRGQTEAEIDFTILVSVPREDGIVVLMQAMEKVADALQTTTAGRIAVLAGTVNHFSWRTEGNYVVDGSLNGQLIITAKPVVKTLGLRR